MCGLGIVKQVTFQVACGRLYYDVVCTVGVCIGASVGVRCLLMTLHELFGGRWYQSRSCLSVVEQKETLRVDTSPPRARFSTEWTTMMACGS